MYFVCKCPFCAETIKAEAIVCRYCGRDLPQDFIQARKIKRDEWEKHLRKQTSHIIGIRWVLWIALCIVILISLTQYELEGPGSETSKKTSRTQTAQNICFDEYLNSAVSAFSSVGISVSAECTWGGRGISVTLPFYLPKRDTIYAGTKFLSKVAEEYPNAPIEFVKKGTNIFIYFEPIEATRVKGALNYDMKWVRFIEHQ